MTAKAKEEKPDVEFEGVEISIGQEKYILPPLSFRQLRKYQPLLEEYSGKTKEEIMRKASLFDLLRLTPVVHAALSRNYPSITLDEIEDKMGIESAADGKLLKIVTAVFGVSGVEALPKRGGAKAAAR